MQARSLSPRNSALVDSCSENNSFGFDNVLKHQWDGKFGLRTYVGTPERRTYLRTSTAGSARRLPSRRNRMKSSWTFRKEISVFEFLCDDRLTQRGIDTYHWIFENTEPAPSEWKFRWYGVHNACVTNYHPTYVSTEIGSLHIEQRAIFDCGILLTNWIDLKTPILPPLVTK